MPADEATGKWDQRVVGERGGLSFSASLAAGPLVMGVLNVTPDSFSDGGRFQKTELALQQARLLCQEGAHVIDIGGESSRPGAQSVSVSEELDRVMPVIEKLKARHDVLISVDTSKPVVMDEAIKAGADMINDIRALAEEAAVDVVAPSQASVCLMHMQGTPVTMQNDPSYGQTSADVVDQVLSFLENRLLACEAAGLSKSRCWIDPGFGFGKTLAHNLILMKNLPRFLALDCPILVGVSRKSMIGQLLGKEVDQRLVGGLGLAFYALMRGASMIRTHDVAETVDLVRIWQALRGEEVVACGE